MGEESTEQCIWCGKPVEPDDGWRSLAQPGARRAVFCRLEHVVPWHIQGPRWEAGEPDEPLAPDDSPAACSQCGEPLDDVRFVLIRHRGDHRIPDAFCSVEHMAAWASGGGRWAG